MLRLWQIVMLPPLLWAAIASMPGLMLPLLSITTAPLPELTPTIPRPPAVIGPVEEIAMFPLTEEASMPLPHCDVTAPPTVIETFPAPVVAARMPIVGLVTLPALNPSTVTLPFVVTVRLPPLPAASIPTLTL